MTTTPETIKVKIAALPQANVQNIFMDMLKLIEKMGAELAARDSEDAERMAEIINRHSPDPETTEGKPEDFDDMREQVSKERQPGESELMFSKEELESGHTITEQGSPELTSPITETQPIKDDQNAPDKGNTE